MLGTVVMKTIRNETRDPLKLQHKTFNKSTPITPRFYNQKRFRSFVCEKLELIDA